MSKNVESVKVWIVLILKEDSKNRKIQNVRKSI